MNEGSVKIHTTKRSDALAKLTDEIFQHKKKMNMKEFLEEMSVETGIPVSMNNQELIIQISGVGAIEGKGIWIHPDIAINLGQWLSPKYNTKEFLDFIDD